VWGWAEPYFEDEVIAELLVHISIVHYVMLTKDRGYSLEKAVGTTRKS
jgi:hypothetical protein